MLQVTGVSLQYGSKKLFEDVNLKFTKGNCYGIIGANGAGKSTLLNTICGMQEYESGEINRKSGLNIGYLKQNSGLSGENTIWEEMRGLRPGAEGPGGKERLHGEMADCPPDSPEYKALSREYDPESCLFRGQRRLSHRREDQDDLKRHGL